MKDFNVKITSTRHVPREYVRVCGNTMSDCTVQLCLLKAKQSGNRKSFQTKCNTGTNRLEKFTLYFKPSAVALSTWEKWGNPKAVWSAPSSVVCMQSLSNVQWLHLYMYIPFSIRTFTNKKRVKQRSKHTFRWNIATGGGGDKSSVDLHNLYALSLHAARAFDHAHLFLLFWYFHQ